MQQKLDTVQSTQILPLFALCQYSNNIWMHKFQQLFSKCPTWSVTHFDPKPHPRAWPMGNSSSSSSSSSMDFSLTCSTGATSTSVDPLPGRWLAACMADLTPDLKVCLSWGSLAKSFHSLQFLSISCFYVTLGLPGPCFPSTCRSKAVLTAPLGCSTCPYQRSLLSFRMWSRSSMPSRASSSLNLVVTMFCGLTLQICLIIALSFRCRRRFGFVNGQVSLAWSIALPTQELYTRPRVLKERWQEERTGSSSLNFFQAVFTRVVVDSHQLLRACLLVAKGSYHL